MLWAGWGFEPTTTQLQTGIRGKRANNWATAAELRRQCIITRVTDSDPMIQCRSNVGSCLLKRSSWNELASRYPKASPSMQQIQRIYSAWSSHWAGPLLSLFWNGCCIGFCYFGEAFEYLLAPDSLLSARNASFPDAQFMWSCQGGKWKQRRGISMPNLTSFST